MNGQGKLLTHYLKNADKLIIPVYQRNYDWREEHCKKLYQDLVRTIQNKKRWHFFGGIVSVSDPIKPWSDGGKTELDNGQMLCKHHNRVKGNK